MDKVEICNIALGRIGAADIERIDEASKAARTCRRFFDVDRKNVLEKFPWTFATRRVQLALLNENPPDYKYAYRYPSDCLKIRRIYNKDYSNEKGECPYQLLSDTSGRKLYTDVELASIEYTADIEDVTLFSSQFVEALSWKLAADLAMAITSNANIAQYCLQGYNEYFIQAAGEDAIEDGQLDPVHDRLALARWEGL